MKKMAPALRLRLAAHLAACMPLGFARHGAVRRDCTMSGPVLQGGVFHLGTALR